MGPVTWDQAKASVARSFRVNQGGWALQTALGELGLSAPIAPRLPAVGLHPPTERAALANVEATLTWAEAWRRRAEPCLIWEDRSWASLGRQSLPIRLQPETPAHAARIAGQASDFARLTARMKALLEDSEPAWRHSGNEPVVAGEASVRLAGGEEPRAAFAGEDGAGPGDVAVQTAGGEAAGDEAAAEAGLGAVEVAVQATGGEAAAASEGGAFLGALRRGASALAELSETEFGQLRGMVAWLEAHPGSGLYPRQLPVRGVDSKWLDRHRVLVAGLVGALTGLPDLGLAKPPPLVRGRLLDGALAKGAPLDFSAPPVEWDRLGLEPRAVLIVENLQSLLALPGDEGSGLAAFHGGGYAVDLLGGIGWLKEAPVLYWGDLDVDGLAILNRLRHHLPHVASVMMDLATLEEFADLSVGQPPRPAASLDRLTPAEQAAYRELQASGRRLEQERIPWGTACARLLQARPRHRSGGE
jgi:hypothetical protein